MLLLKSSVFQTFFHAAHLMGYFSVNGTPRQKRLKLQWNAITCSQGRTEGRASRAPARGANLRGAPNFDPIINRSRVHCWNERPLSQIIKKKSLKNFASRMANNFFWVYLVTKKTSMGATILWLAWSAEFAWYGPGHERFHSGSTFWSFPQELKWLQTSQAQFWILLKYSF